MDPKLVKTDTGFTLIELMIAVTVLALLTTTLTLSINRPTNQQAADFARFQSIHARLREQAILSRQILGLAVDADGYQRLRRDGGDWQPVGTPVQWRGAVTVIEPFDRRAPLQFAPSGQSTVVRLRFEAETGSRICATDGWKAVSCDGG